MGKIKCMLFDLDGTLVDSMPYWREAVVRSIREKYGQMPAYTQELEEQAVVLPFPEARKLLSATLGIPLDEISVDRDYTRDLMALFYRAPDLIREKGGVCDLLREAHEKGIKTGLLTATRRPLMMPLLERLGLLPHLDLICTPEDYPKGKATADIFVGAMGALGASASETVLYEDSLYSMEVAHALGIRIVAVKDRSNRLYENEIAAIADAVLSFDDMGDVPDEVVRRYESFLSK